MESSREAVYTQNRELSWLRFNDSVLSEAMDESVPLLERLKFISIFTSNLDEFFMIRVGSLHDLETLGSSSVDKKSGMTATQQLRAIYQAVGPLYEKRERVFRDVEQQLRLHGVYQLSAGELGTADRKYLRRYFDENLAPILSPQIIDTHHPFPHLQNKVIHVGARLRRKGKEVLALIPVPAAASDVVFLPGSDVRCIPTEQILLSQLSSVFSTYTVEEATAFCVTRNADINPEDEAFDFDDDFRGKMRKVLGKRRRLDPVRLEYSGAVSDPFLAALCERLSLRRDQTYRTDMPMKLGYVFSLADRLAENKRRTLLYPPFHPQAPACVRSGESVTHQIRQHDLLLSYPFESMDPFLRLLKESASDPAVVSIKITIYRLAKRAKLVDYLCQAAENGKDVTVLIELRARFDEQNNIDWSERLEDAGCTVIYGFEDYKVHSKICLITRRERAEIRFLTQVGTGNYNEKTAAMYTDLSLMTASQDIGADANEFFKNMAIGNLEGHYRHLLVAPVSLKQRVMEEIDREIAKGAGGPHPHQDQLPDRSGSHRKAQAGQLCRRAGPNDRAGHLLPAAGHPGADGAHPDHQHRGPLPGTLPGLLLRQRSGGADVHRLGGLHDPEHGAAGGDRLSHHRSAGPAEDPQDPGCLPAGYPQGQGHAVRRHLSPPDPGAPVRLPAVPAGGGGAPGTLPGDGRRGRACLRRAAPETAAVVPADIRPAFSGAEPGVPGFRPAFCKLPVTECVFL